MKLFLIIGLVFILSLVRGAKAEIFEHMRDYPIDIDDVMNHVPSLEYDAQEGRLSIRAEGILSVKLVQKTGGEAETELCGTEEEWILPEKMRGEDLSEQLLGITIEQDPEQREYVFEFQEDGPQILLIDTFLQAEPEKHYLIHYDTETFQYVRGNVSASYYLKDGKVIRNMDPVLFVPEETSSEEE